MTRLVAGGGWGVKKSAMRMTIEKTKPLRAVPCCTMLYGDVDLGKRLCN